MYTRNHKFKQRRFILGVACGRALRGFGSLDIMGMIGYEMIGYFYDVPNSQYYPNHQLSAIYPNVANFIVVVGINEHEELNKKVHI